MVGFCYGGNMPASHDHDENDHHGDPDDGDDDDHDDSDDDDDLWLWVTPWENGKWDRGEKKEAADETGDTSHPWK